MMEEYGLLLTGLAGWLAPRRLLQNNVELRRAPALLTNQSGALSLVETFIELKYFPCSSLVLHDIKG